jgi:leader peptidase (prepilin peptidase)/N-methyltransferase
VTPTLIASGLLFVWWFLIGAATGSFLCVVIERVPAGESIMGRSHCVCGRQLKGFENIPVMSWLVLRGKARCCGAKIPSRYILVEVGSGLVFATVAALSPSLLVTCAILAVCVGAFTAVGIRLGSQPSQPAQSPQPGQPESPEQN